MEECGIPTRREEDDARRSDLRQGWYWGSQAFAERMLRIGEAAQRKTRSRGANANLEKQAHGEQEAQRLVAEGMAVAGLSDADLKKLPDSDPRKVAAARAVWERTTVGMPWLAEHLHLRSAVNASQQIRRHRRQPPPLARKLQKWMVQSINAA
jgi:putative transposase